VPRHAQKSPRGWLASTNADYGAGGAKQWLPATTPEDRAARHAAQAQQRIVVAVMAEATRLGMTREDLAAKTNLTAGQVGRYLRGEAHLSFAAAASLLAAVEKTYRVSIGSRSTDDSA
jgi:hypothetical protein